MLTSISSIFPRSTTRPAYFSKKPTESRPQNNPHFGVGGKGDAFQSQGLSKPQQEYAELLQRVAKGQEAEVEKMVSKKMYVNYSYQDQTPLQLAAFHGHTPVIKVLVAAGAKLNQKNSWGETPLWLAVDQQHLESVRELVKMSADVNLADRRGRTPLWVLANKPDKKNVAEEMAKVLIDAGADLNKICEGLTPMQAARQSGNENIVKLLRERGATDRDRQQSIAFWNSEESQNTLRALDRYHKGESARSYDD